MSILIKGIDMPENCRQCDFTHCTHFGQKLCTLLTEAISIKHKLPNCPLSEIPTLHGRLIDADTLTKALEKRWNVDDDQDFANKSVWRELENAPTIVEAEDES